ncbi:MAG: alpha/beta fold hydrolase [Eubacteriales bacterium]|nr:alpha/beta fold hydrolase [Eubacteriales bacterium]
MSRKHDGFFVSEADGLQISAMAVLPEGETYRGIVQLVHGMSEYKERYLPLMEFLAEQGYVTVIHDHRGHGKSIKVKEDLGYMYGGGAQAMLRDIDTVNKRIHHDFPDLPLILMGHSMGSLAVRAFARQHDDRMDMLIVCGSPSYNAARPLGVAIAHAEKAVLGPKHKSKLLEGISFASYVSRFKNDKSCTAWICSDKEVADEYAASELCGFTFTDDAYLALFQLMKEAYDVKHWKCTKPQMPVLFISGEEDPCMGNVRQFAKSVQAMRNAGYYDVKGKLYPGMRHEILNEKDKNKVYRDIAVYLKKKGF